MSTQSEQHGDYTVIYDGDALAKIKADEQRRKTLTIVGIVAAFLVLPIAFCQFQGSQNSATTSTRVAPPIQPAPATALPQPRTSWIPAIKTGSGEYVADNPTSGRFRIKTEGPPTCLIFWVKPRLGAPDSEDIGPFRDCDKDAPAKCKQAALKDAAGRATRVPNTDELRRAYRLRNLFPAGCEVMPVLFRMGVD